MDSPTGPPASIRRALRQDSAVIAWLCADFPGWDQEAITRIIAHTPSSSRMYRGRIYGGIAWLAGGNRSCLVARMVGECAELLLLATDPAWQRHGYGSALIETLAASAARLGAQEIQLEVAIDNAAAQALYRRAGFVGFARRRGYYQGRDALLMSRRLELPAGGGAVPEPPGA